MIKILTLVLLLASGNVFAGSEQSPFDGRHNAKPIVYTECKLGKWFVIAYNANSVSVMQVFEDRNDMVPKPMECGAKNVEANDED